jgi:hypothetical protein
MPFAINTNATLDRSELGVIKVLNAFNYEGKDWDVTIRDPGTHLELGVWNQLFLARLGAVAKQIANKVEPGAFSGAKMTFDRTEEATTLSVGTLKRWNKDETKKLHFDVVEFKSDAKEDSDFVQEFAPKGILTAHKTADYFFNRVLKPRYDAAEDALLPDRTAADDLDEEGQLDPAGLEDPGVLGNGRAPRSPLDLNRSPSNGTQPHQDLTTNAQASRLTPQWYPQATSGQPLSANDQRFAMNAEAPRSASENSLPSTPACQGFGVSQLVRRERQKERTPAPTVSSPRPLALMDEDYGSRVAEFRRRVRLQVKNSQSHSS